MYTPVNPSFTIYKWGLRGSKLYRYVFVMQFLGLLRYFFIFQYLQMHYITRHVIFTNVVHNNRHYPSGAGSQVYFKKSGERGMCPFSFSPAT